MNLEQKIGQLFVVGFKGCTLSEETKAHIKKYHFGNTILFARNIRNAASIKALTNEIQRSVNEETGVPAFIAIDQEGGMVTRIFNGATFMPGSMVFGAAGEKGNTYLEGKFAGMELKELGINFNLAPVLDVNCNHHNPLIGVRAYSDDPEKVSSLGTDYIKGLQEQGVMATGKHFPGYGDIDRDSHLQLPCVNKDCNSLYNVNMLSFRCAIKNGIAAIMTAHVLFPSLEPKNIPATLSHRILTGILREELGFKGLIISDCLEMKAIDDMYTTEQGAVKAILAGADLLCISHTPERQAGAFEAVLKAVKDGVISEERIDESVDRILKFKEHFAQPAKIHVSADEAAKHVCFSQNVSRESMTLVKDTNGLLPVLGSGTLVISTEPVSTSNADDKLNCQKSFAEVFAERTNAKPHIISIKPSDDEIKAIAKSAASYKKIVVATYNAHIYTEQVKLVKEIYKLNKNIIVLMLRNPYDIECFPEVPCCIAAYEYTRLSVQNAVDTLTGNIEINGKMPVKLNI